MQGKDREVVKRELWAGTAAQGAIDRHMFVYTGLFRGCMVVVVGSDDVVVITCS